MHLHASKKGYMMSFSQKKIAKKIREKEMGTLTTYTRGLSIHTIGHYTNSRPAKACKCFLPDILSSRARY